MLGKRATRRETHELVPTQGSTILTCFLVPSKFEGILSLMTHKFDAGGGGTMKHAVLGPTSPLGSTCERNKIWGFSHQAARDKYVGHSF